MSKADEMLKQLGYKKIYGEYIECGYIGGNHNRIMFTNRKTINGKLCEDLTMQELQAINEKVKELRMEQLDKNIKEKWIMQYKEDKEFELDMVIETLFNELKKKKDIKQALKENEFAEYTIETPYYSGIIKIEKLKEK